MSFNRELYYDQYDAMLGITKEQADAKEEATRKNLKERELKFRRDSQDPQVRYNYNLQMPKEEQSPKKQNQQKRENIAELYSNALNVNLPQFTTPAHTPQAVKDGQIWSGSTNSNQLDTSFMYNYSDYLSGGKPKKSELVSPQNDDELRGTTTISMQDSFELRAKADNLRNKTEEENKKALRKIDKMKNNPQNSEHNLLFKYKDGIFTNAFKPNDDNVTYPSYLPEQQNNNQTKKDDGYDLEKALEHLRSSAKPNSMGKCGRYVRDAIAAGGISDPTVYESAKDYIGLMPKLGFTQIDSKSYTPRAGDVVIHDENGINHPDGHAAMFDGEKWISDFIQIDMYGGSAYRNNPNYTLWRR